MGDNFSQETTITLSNGHKMPLVGLGMWLILGDDVEKSMNAALDAGYRHFDTATLYGNEEEVGKVLKKWIESGKIKREELFIVTKLPWNGMAPERVETFLNSSLRRFQLDYVDLYLLHWPIGVVFTTEEDLTPMDSNGRVRYDTTTNLEEIWKAMEAQVTKGSAKSIGLSNFNIKQIERICNVATIQPATLQIELHAYFQNTALREFAMSKNIAICGYGVLGSPGRAQEPDSLQGWKFDIDNIPTVLQDPSVKQIAAKHNKREGQILLKYFVQQNVGVLPKSCNADRIKQNISIFDFSLDDEDMKAIQSLDKGDESFRSFRGFVDINNHPESPW